MNSMATKPKKPVLIQIHSTELCGMYSQNSKKLMSGIGTGVEELLAEADAEIGLLRIVNQRFERLELAVEVRAGVRSPSCSGKSTDLTACAGRPSAPSAFHVASDEPEAEDDVVGATNQNARRRRKNSTTQNDHDADEQGDHRRPPLRQQVRPDDRDRQQQRSATAASVEHRSMHAATGR